MRKLLKRLLLVATVFIVAVLIICNAWVTSSARGQIFHRPKDVPARDIGLVLATGVQTNISGQINEHFFTRLKAAADLWHEGRVKRLVVSGSSHASAGDEPAAMAAELKRLGVRSSIILRDDDSWRTLDSMLRVRDQFHGTNVVVISEEFHLARAIFLGKHVGVDAVGFAAKDVGLWSRGKSIAREWFARVKAVLDVYVLHRQGS